MGTDESVAAYVVGRERRGRDERGLGSSGFVRVERVRHTPREVHRGRPRPRECAGPPCAPDRLVRAVCAASATPYAPAAPSAGAPRTASGAIASMSSSTSVQTTKRNRAGQCTLVEQTDRTAPPLDRRRDRFRGRHGRAPQSGKPS